MEYELEKTKRDRRSKMQPAFVICLHFYRLSSLMNVGSLVSSFQQNLCPPYILSEFSHQVEE